MKTQTATETAHSMSLSGDIFRSRCLFFQLKSISLDAAEFGQPIKSASTPSGQYRRFEPEFERFP
jgi:hypothetical protein